MVEHGVQTRAAICGTGILLGIIVSLAHLPVILLVIPAAILFLGVVADPGGTHAVWYGVLSATGVFDPAVLGEDEKDLLQARRHYFWLGECGTAVLVSGAIAAPAGVFLAGITDPALAFAGAVLLFLPLFVFLPKLIRLAMKADTEALVLLIGKNEQAKRVFWSIFLLLAGLLLARMVDPATAGQVIRILAGG
jgi:hypothetical protein